MDREALLSKLVASLDIESNLDNVASKMVQLLPAQDKERVMAMINTCKKEIIKAYTKVYGEIFSDDELEVLVTINDTPAMKKLKNKQHEIFQKVDHYSKMIIMKYIAEKSLEDQSILPANNFDRNMN